jgi:hypothetical protein
LHLAPLDGAAGGAFVKVAKLEGNMAFRKLAVLDIHGLDPVQHDYQLRTSGRYLVGVPFAAGLGVGRYLRDIGDGPSPVTRVRPLVEPRSVQIVQPVRRLRERRIVSVIRDRTTRLIKGFQGPNNLSVATLLVQSSRKYAIPERAAAKTGKQLLFKCPRRSSVRAEVRPFAHTQSFHQAGSPRGEEVNT